jgi:predicted transcriptional regulator
VHIVSLLPGIHLRELQRLLGISFSSTRYNVDKLCNSGEITSHRDNGHLRLYPKGTRDDERQIFSILRNRTAVAILNAVVDESLSHKQLCERTRIAKSTVSEYLSHLTEIGFIKVKLSSDLKTLYELQNDNKLLQALLSSNLIRPPGSATERFIDLWDF